MATEVFDVHRKDLLRGNTYEGKQQVRTMNAGQENKKAIKQKTVYLSMLG